MSENNISANMVAAEIDRRGRFDAYNQIARVVLTIPLFINAGAAIALVSFFTGDKIPTPLTIKVAATFFILGAVFGFLSIAFEFMVFFHAKNAWIEHYSSVYKLANDQPGPISEEYGKLYNNPEFPKNRVEECTVNFRIANGLLSVIFFFLAISALIQYLWHTCIVTLGLAVAIVLYMVVVFYDIRSKSKLVP